ncbi:unnamed protein product [Polarella glacialis]|uniref:Uncharacterized protein n=1 Tax=Polarella glacialis TaxID=89957 RepID=A0A813F5K8_POLGL|nr:unnamed protein product [Polarella glacialis]
MPQIARADPRSMSLPQLVSHGREAALRWRIEYPAFWEAFFQRLRELREEVRLVEAARLLHIFAQLRLVDLELVDFCVQLVAEAEAEALLDLKEQELTQAAEALGAMQRPEAMAVVLRPLVARVHRLDVGLLVRLLAVAKEVGCSMAGDLADAGCRALVERNNNNNNTNNIVVVIVVIVVIVVVIVIVVVV